MATSQYLNWSDLSLTEHEWSGGTSTLSSATWGDIAVVAKEFEPSFLDEIDLTALDAMVAFAATARASESACAEVANWPLALLGEPGDIRGVVLPLLGPEFMHIDHEPYEVRARGLDLVGISQEFAQTTKRRYHSGPERVRVLGKTLNVLLTLHTSGVIFNDVQPLNFAVNSTGTDVLALDCDSMWGPWGQTTGTLGPVDYQQQHEDASPESDLLKFSHIAVRVLQTSLHDPELRPHLLAPLLPEPHQVILWDALHGTCAVQDDWARIAMSWRSVDDSGAMFVASSAGGMGRWTPPTAPSPQLPVPGSWNGGGGHVQQHQPAGPPAQRSGSLTPAVWAGIALLIAALIVVLALALA